MKKLMCMLVAAALWGCDDFLEETSQNQIRPSTVSDMEKILEGEGYLTEDESYMFNYATSFLTDEIKCNQEDESLSSQLRVKHEWRRMFCYDVTMFDEGDEDEAAHEEFWSLPYERIKGCNIVLDYLDDMQGDEERKEYLRGEALALRGFYYLHLVNWFSLPYTYGDPNQNMGVPLKLVSGVTEDKPVRGTVAGVYEQIERDLLEGARLMRQYPQNLTLYRMNGLAAYGLLSRMYLYMERWDEVIQYADSVLNEKPQLLSFAENTGYGKVWSVYYSPDEILWACHYELINSGSNQIFVTNKQTTWLPSDELVNVFGEDLDPVQEKDIRADVRHSKTYFQRGYATGQPEWVAGILKSTGADNAGIRTGEVYLNRAEAYIRKYVETEDAAAGQRGLDDLNELRRNRFDGYIEKQLSDFATPQELLDFCLRERQRELCWEGNFRWFDLRRNGMPRIEHEFFYVETEKTSYVLEEGDPRYALPIPQTALDRNSSLRQNEY